MLDHFGYASSFQHNQQRPFASYAFFCTSLHCQKHSYSIARHFPPPSSVTKALLLSFTACSILFNAWWQSATRKLTAQFQNTLPLGVLLESLSFCSRYFPCVIRFSKAACHAWYPRSWFSSFFPIDSFRWRNGMSLFSHDSRSIRSLTVEFPDISCSIFQHIVFSSSELQPHETWQLRIFDLHLSNAKDT